METQPPLPNPTIDLPAQAYRYLIHTLLVLLPPPITDTAEAILLRNHAGDIKLMMKLTAQYSAMFRSSVTALDRLRREQQTRIKRATSQEDADTNEWTCHIAANTMLQALAQAQTKTQAAPETDPESHTLKSETPMRQSAHQIIDLAPQPLTWGRPAKSAPAQISGA